MFNRPYLKTKSPAQLVRESEQPERAMKRSLSALDLTLLGVGAIIGTGIFVLTGTAAAGGRPTDSAWETPVIHFLQSAVTHADLAAGRPAAGPAIMLSFLVAAVACGLAALCYAELAAMIPVAGSAYTYSYATMGELVAWIIGWDLILEYALTSTVVASSWSRYFLAFCHAVFGWKFPLWLATDPTTAQSLLKKGGDALQDFSSTALPTVFGHPLAVNAPALLIMVLVTALLVYGIQASARANTAVVAVKLAVVVFVIAFGAFSVQRSNWVPFAPSGVSGVLSGAAVVFFAYIGFDAVSTAAEETRKPQRDLPIGMIASLIICTLLYVLMSGVLTGMRKYTEFVDDAAPVASVFVGRPWVQAAVSAGALAGMTSVLLVFQLGQPRILLAMGRDGLLPPLFAKVHPRFRTPWVTTILTGLLVGVAAMFADISTLASLTNIGTLFAFVLVCLGVIRLRKTAPGDERPFRVPLVPWLPLLGVGMCGLLMLSLPVLTWVRFAVWLAVGLAIYFAYGVRHSRLQQEGGDPPPVSP